MVSSFTDKPMSLNFWNNYMTAEYLSHHGTFALHLTTQIVIVITSTKGTSRSSWSFSPPPHFFSLCILKSFKDLKQLWIWITLLLQWPNLFYLCLLRLERKCFFYILSSQGLCLFVCFQEIDIIFPLVFGLNRIFQWSSGLSSNELKFGN